MRKVTRLGITLTMMVFLTGFGGRRDQKELSASAWIQGQGIYGYGPTAFAVSGKNILAGTSYAASSLAYVFLSSDSGLTWTLDGSFPVFNHTPGTASYVVPTVTFLKDGNDVFAGFGDVFAPTHAIYVSTDDGVTWTDRDTEFVQPANCFVSSDSAVYVGADNGVYVTIDQGRSWAPTNRAELSLPVSALTSLGSLLFAGTEGEGIYLSTNGGKSWSITGDTSSSVFSLATMGHIVFAATDFDTSIGGGLFMSSDSGTTWTRASLPGSMLYAMSAGKKRLFVATNSAIVMSTDTGQTWEVIPTSNNVTGAIIALKTDGQYLLAGSNTGSPISAAAWRASLSQLTGIERNPSKPPSRFTLLQNFPNPFNPTTVIEYQLPDTRFVTLRVYDILGRRVATLVKERQNAGTHSLTFNASRLPSGIYFYRLQAGNAVLAKKLMLLK